MRAFTTWMCAAVAAVLSSGTTLAQDLMELDWRLGEDGRLLVLSANDARGTWAPMFAGLLERYAGDESSRAKELLECGPMVLLPLLLTGEGGAAAIDEAALRLRKIGVRLGLGSDAIDAARRDAFGDLLRVQYLAAIDVYEATRHLVRIANDEDRDPFVRAAAAAAAAGRPGIDYEAEALAAVRAKRNGPAALQAGLLQLPDDFDLLIGVHSAALPTAGKLLAAWRQYQLRLASQALLAAGGSVGPAQLGEHQLRFDFPGQLPCELAVRFGNWRVDHALFALRCSEPDWWWFHLGGVFQPARIAEGLRKSGFEMRVGSDNEVRANIEGWELRATATEFEGWQVGASIGPRGKHVSTLHGKAAANAPPVWLHMPASSRLAARVSLPLRGFDASFLLQGPQLRAEASCTDAAAAQVVLRRWDEWRVARHRDLEAMASGPEGWKVTWKETAEEPPGRDESTRTSLVLRRCLQGMHVTVAGERVLWNCYLAPFSLDELVRLLAVLPLAMQNY